MPSLSKINKVNQLADTLKNTAHYVLVNFGTTSHQKLEALRAKLSSHREAVFHVVKNSLLAIAGRKAGKKELTDIKTLQGPSALLTLSHEWGNTLSTLYQFMKTEGTFSFKIGRIDNLLYGADELLRIAKLPSKDALLSKIIGTLRWPHTRLVRGMKSPMVKLVYVLKTRKAGE